MPSLYLFRVRNVCFKISTVSYKSLTIFLPNFDIFRIIFKNGNVYPDVFGIISRTSDGAVFCISTFLRWSLVFGRLLVLLRFHIVHVDNIRSDHGQTTIEIHGRN